MSREGNSPHVAIGRDDYAGLSVSCRCRIESNRIESNRFTCPDQHRLALVQIRITAASGEETPYDKVKAAFLIQTFQPLLRMSAARQPVSMSA